LKIQMSHRVVGAFAISLTLSAAHARAQDDQQEGDAAKPATTDAAKAAEEEEEEAEPKPAAEAKAEVKAEIGTSTGAQAEASTSGEAKPGEAAKAAQRPVMYGQRGDWFIQPYGYARFDGIHDTTQSFEDGIQPNLVARPGTYKGDHRRTILVARDSRVGIYVGAPDFHGIKTTAQIEFDFFGLPPTDVRRHDKDVFSPIRMRHAYFKLETPVLDVIAGQYYTPFGWNGHFYPATGAFLGVPAQVYHRDPQLRLERALHFGDGALTVTAAVVRPGQKDSGIPDVHGGILFEHHAWSGAATSGFGRPAIVPISVGVSGLYRRFEVPAFRSDPASEALRTQGWGAAAQVLLPVIPANTVEERSNALTITGEFSLGTGIADLYTGMDGGSRLPLLPNPSMMAPAYVYPQNIDPGLITIDRTFAVKTINWKAFVVGAQYYLPIGGGKVGISGIYSRVWSDNIKELTPAANWGGIFTKMEYIDATVSVEVTPAVYVGGSFQTVKQTFGDMVAPTPNYGERADAMPGISTVPGTGNVPATARNNRGQLTMAFFF
jgi:hypothetical protein